MSTIIAARFDAQEKAGKACAQLKDAGFMADEMSLFFVNPHGQHDIFPIGGDADVSPGAEDSGKGAIAGAGMGAVAGAVAGAATAPITGPIGPMIGAGVGAYTGSLAGALNQTDKKSDVDVMADETPLEEDELTERTSGVLVAVKVTGNKRQRAIDVFRQNNAKELEEAEGELKNGDWTDFDPRKAVRLLPEDTPG